MAAPPLPPGNLLVNPWFRSAADPNLAGLDGWENTLVDGVGWGTSQKDDNPSPEILIAEDCDFLQVYCGTSARWATILFEEVTYAYPGMDVYLSQVVQANPANRLLQFSMYWVNHRLDIAEVRIYGSRLPNGPWQSLWTPIQISQDQNLPLCCTPGHNGIPWFETPPLQTVLEKGYPYYKVVLHARYPVPFADSGDVGVKITGVYFTAVYTDNQPNLSTPVVVHNPTAAPTVTPGSTAAFTPTPTNFPTSTSPVRKTPTPTSPGPTTTLQVSPTPTPTSRR
jgi:hypothetical protein